MCFQSPAKLLRATWARWMMMCDEGELQRSAIIYSTTTYGFPLKCWAEVIINESHLLFCGKSAAYFNLHRLKGQSGLKYVTFHLRADQLENPHVVCQKWPFYLKFLHTNPVLYQLVSEPKSVMSGSLSWCTAVTVNTSKKISITYTHTHTPVGEGANIIHAARFVFYNNKKQFSGAFRLHSGSGKIWPGKANENHAQPSSAAGVSLNQWPPPSCSSGAEQCPNRKIKRLGEVGSSLVRSCKSIHMWNRSYLMENQLRRDPFSQILWFKSVLFNIGVMRLGCTCKTQTRNTHV